MDRSRLEVPEFVFIFAMMIAFLYAMLADLMGLSGIVGAFIARVAFEGVGLKNTRTSGSAEYLQIIFASIFFVSLGSSRTSGAYPEIIVFLAVLTLVAIATKVVGCACRPGDGMCRRTLSSSGSGWRRGARWRDDSP
jgi:Kef-type K+ transport system membrane component KefB